MRIGIRTDKARAPGSRAAPGASDPVITRRMARDLRAAEAMTPEAHRVVDELIREVQASQTAQSLLAAQLARLRAQHRARPDRSAEIALRCRLLNNHARRFKPQQAWTHAQLEQRVRALQVMHRDLWEAGCKLLVVDNFKPRHAMHLLEWWRTKGLARSTVQERWALLDWWADNGLEKPGILPPLQRLWPAEARAPAEAEPTAPGSKPPNPHAPRAPRARAAAVDPARLAAALMARDARAGWMLRLKQELGLTVLQAARIDPLACTTHVGLLMTRAVGAHKSCAIELATASQRDLVAALRDWALQPDRARGALGWPDLSPVQVVRRFDYLQRCARKSIEPETGQDGGSPPVEHAQAEQRDVESAS